MPFAPSPVDPPPGHILEQLLFPATTADLSRLANKHPALYAYVFPTPALARSIAMLAWAGTTCRRRQMTAPRSHFTTFRT